MSTLYTATFRYAGTGRYDVTRKSNHPLSPSWTLVQDALEVTQGGYAACFPAPRFRERYLAELRASYVQRRDVFAQLVHDTHERGSTVLVCYCKEAGGCCRSALADALVAVAGKLGTPLARGRELKATSGGMLCFGGKRGCVPFVTWDQPDELQK